MGFKDFHVHFVGVSGIGLSAVAYLSLKMGLRVSGCSDEENEQTEMLKKSGMRYSFRHHPSHVEGSSLVVRSAAVPDDNKEIKAAMDLKIPVLYYSEYLGILMAQKIGIGVAGTHGKTTTTGMLSEILSEAELYPTIVCGGVLNRFGSNAVYGHGDFFITEACEYKRNFLDLPRYYSIVTNIEAEHLDYYKDLDDILSAFRAYIQSSKLKTIVNGDDRNISRIVSSEKIKNTVKVGYSDTCDYRICDVLVDNGYYSFRLASENCKTERIRLSVPGKFNVENAALAAACSFEIGVAEEPIVSGLTNYRGTKRRLEVLLENEDIIVYSDYAHHPTEIIRTISALRELHPEEKILVVFQPHQYSRTKIFLREFSEVLSNADGVILMEIYGQRDSEETKRSISIVDLFELLRKRVKNPVYCTYSEQELLKIFGDNNLLDFFSVIIFMGAGSIDDVARRFVRKL